EVKDACHMALVCPITDDVEVRTTMGGAIDAIFG
ncbi:MAG TPA: AAA family ATPase, partial [Gammaproteobacteria bacterium]|nr:AAA family ATPase [Gammaproteobacteria bacterium]